MPHRGKLRDIAGRNVLAHGPTVLANIAEGQEEMQCADSSRRHNNNGPGKSDLDSFLNFPQSVIGNREPRLFGGSSGHPGWLDWVVPAVVIE